MKKYLYVTFAAILISPSAYGGGGMLMQMGGGVAAVGGGGCDIESDFSTSTNWTNVNGDITISAGVANGSAGARAIGRYDTSLGSANQTVQAECQIDGTDGSGVYFRADGSGNGYALYLHTTTSIRLVTISSGSGLNEVGTHAVSTLTEATNYTLKVIISGTSITAYIDDVEVWATTDSTYSAGNYAGVIIDRVDWTGAPTVDDFCGAAN